MTDLGKEERRDFLRPLSFFYTRRQRLGIALSLGSPAGRAPHQSGTCRRGVGNVVSVGPPALGGRVRFWGRRSDQLGADTRNLRRRENWKRISDPLAILSGFSPRELPHG